MHVTEHSHCARTHDRYGGISKSAAGLKVNEHYLRKDLPCQSLRCQRCVHIDKKRAGGGGAGLLSASATHYFVPCCDVLLDFLDIVKAAGTGGQPALDFLLLETVLQQARKRLPQPHGCACRSPTRYRMLPIHRDVRARSISSRCRRGRRARASSGMLSRWAALTHPALEARRPRVHRRAPTHARVRAMWPAYLRRHCHAQELMQSVERRCAFFCNDHSVHTYVKPEGDPLKAHRLRHAAVKATAGES